MYESFFQFQKRPFPAAPDAGSYVGIGSIEAARDTIARCIEHGAGPALLVGPAGTGKTTLCQVLAEQFRGQFAVALLASGRICSRRALLQAVLFELGLPYRDMEEGELRLSLIDHVSRGDKCPNGMLLLVDEAHTLPLRLLEEVRMITNLVRDGQPRVRLVLAGGPVLEERFANPKLESFNQRIAARCYLESFNRDETFGYIHAQVAAAGGDGAAIFPEDALRAVHHATDGIPRLINQVADHALMLASIGRRGQLDAAGIEEAWADLQQLPAPCTAEGAHSPAESSDVIEFGALDDVEDDPLQDVAADPAQQLDEIERKVAQAGDDLVDQPQEDSGDFVPAGTIGPEVELVFHGPHQTPAASAEKKPQEDEFEEEEVVVDRYTVVREEDVEEEAVTERFAVVEEDDVAGDDQPDVVQAPAADEDAIEAAEDPVVSEPAVRVAGPRHPVMPEQMPEVASIRPADLVAAIAPQQADAPAEATAGRIVADDRDIIVVEEDPDAPAAEEQRATEKPRRREYRRLFATLRQRQA